VAPDTAGAGARRLVGPGRWLFAYQRSLGQLEHLPRCIRVNTVFSSVKFMVETRCASTTGKGCGEANWMHSMTPGADQIALERLFVPDIKTSNLRLLIRRLLFLAAGFVAALLLAEIGLRVSPYAGLYLWQWDDCLG